MKTELDDKYLVIKFDDCSRYLTDTERAILWVLADKILHSRRIDGKTDWEGLCIRDTWPEYEEVKAKLLERINNENRLCS